MIPTSVNSRKFSSFVFCFPSSTFGLSSVAFHVLIKIKFDGSINHCVPWKVGSKLGVDFQPKTNRTSSLNLKQHLSRYYSLSTSLTIPLALKTQR